MIWIIAAWILYTSINTAVKVHGQKKARQQVLAAHHANIAAQRAQEEYWRAQNRSNQNTLLQNQAAYQSAMQGLAQSDPYRNVGLGLPLNPRATEPTKERTAEEIREQLEARYAEMEAEAARMAKAALTACSACRWGNGVKCTQPLMAAFDDYVIIHDRASTSAKLCGPEKALWEPKLTRWQRFIEWIHRIIDRLEAPLALNDGVG